MAEECASPQARDTETVPNYDLELLKTIPNGTIFSYNLDERETPGGMKVRWKFRVVTGPEGARADARQTEAIKEALQWVHRHYSPAGKRTGRGRCR